MKHLEDVLKDPERMKIVSVAMSREELLQIVADCNNVIMKGSYSGDDMLDAAALMLRLSGIYETLLQDVEELPEEHA